MRKWLVIGLASAVLVVAAVILVAGAGTSESAAWLQAHKAGDLTLPARVQGRSIEAATANGYAPMFWPGVNLGPTTPGHQPGEVAATREEYDRWLRDMGDLGVRVVRIYTILRPSFYDALNAYDDAHVDAPIMLIQGVWIPEEEFYETENAYSKPVTDGFRAEIKNAVDVVHGDADLPERRGHAGGTYTTDVSRWLLAFSIGVEWDAYAVESTDKKNAGQSPFKGKYIQATSKATPMESWIASMLDYTASRDAQRGWSRPLTFTNWLTVDPLKHPEEPLDQEDLVSVDATHIGATDKWPGGFFASYHAYPYYPDFMRFGKSYQSYKRPRDGKVDPYAGYLHALRKYHGDQAVAITEFGVPSSLGIAHNGPVGRTQGNHSEQEAMRIDADMLRDIHDEGFASGILFSWIDEWFKFTWNTLDLELPRDRRQLWRNDLTNEEHFGVIAAEPGNPRSVVVLDGRNREWDTNGSSVIGEGQGIVREVQAVSDPQSLYLRLRLGREDAWREHPITIGIDDRKGANRGLPGHDGVFAQGDVAVTVGPEDAEMFQAGWWEPTRIRYGLGRGFMDVDPQKMKRDSGGWFHPLQILSREQLNRTTGKMRPAEFHELKTLKIGSGDPRDEHFDERTLVAAHGNTVEMRLPWALLGYSDPSSQKLYVEHQKEATTTTDALPIRVAVVAGDDPVLTTSAYTVEPWTHVTWHERRKAGFDGLGQTMRDLWAQGADG
jgi:hypothetical protein